MRVDAFDYELPPERIAQRPAEDRESARLLDLTGAELAHRSIAELSERIPAGALVVFNDTRVIRARLIGRKAETGGRVEIFLVKRLGTRTIELSPHLPPREVEVWRALGKASKPLKFGSDVGFGVDTEIAPRLVARLLGRADDDGLLEVGLYCPAGESTEAAIHACGHVPLPPYIKREDDAQDEDRYQTIFARKDGAIAAPTAGLHITRALLGRLVVRGCEIATVTLHVGLGTFQPVTVEDLDAHPMHTESYAISKSTAAAIARARDRGTPVVAVGTTVVRALESAALHGEGENGASGETRLLIQPGYRFRVVDMLLTNFHLPKSTLLALVCAFAGTSRVLEAYRAAVAESYRFFSYGDAMLLRRAEDASPPPKGSEGS